MWLVTHLKRRLTRLTMKKNSPTKRRKTLTQVEFAAAEAVTKQAVNRWVKLGMPREFDGTIDPVAARKWLRENSARSTNASASQSLTANRSRREAATAALRELELRVKQGELVSREEVARSIGNVIVGAKSR